MVGKAFQLGPGDAYPHARCPFQDLFLGHLDVPVLRDGRYVHAVPARRVPLHRRVQRTDRQIDGVIQGDILFIDEIHRLSKVVEEFLYPAMENFEIDFVIDKGPYAKTIKFHLKPFTLVGATTRSGLLTSPLRSRFGMFYHLDFYDVEELADVVERSAKLLGMEIDRPACLEIGRRSRGTPRIANRLLRRVRDHAQVAGVKNIDAAFSTRALNELGTDTFGLDELDRRVLRLIIESFDGGPVGVESLAASLNEEPDTIIDTVEPYLLKAGYLKRTSRGRVASNLRLAALE